MASSLNFEHVQFDNQTSRLLRFTRCFHQERVCFMTPEINNTRDGMSVVKREEKRTGQMENDSVQKVSRKTDTERTALTTCRSTVTASTRDLSDSRVFVLTPATCV